MVLFGTEARQGDNQHVSKLLFAKRNETNKKHVFCGTDYVTNFIDWMDVFTKEGNFSVAVTVLTNKFLD